MDTSPTNTTHPAARGWALFPLAVFFGLYLATFLCTGDLSGMPVSVAFLLTTAVALVFCRGSISLRLGVFCRGAGNETALYMVVIFILAGAFAGCAGAMGAIDATVGLLLGCFPPRMIPAALFLAACLVSMTMGTSCGTIAALMPIGAGLSPATGMSPAAMAGIVVGGAMFGDNLSFISDTTIVVTRGLGVRMRDKFLVNLRLVLPAAVAATGLYLWMGWGLSPASAPAPGEVEWVRTLPCAGVLLAALCGLNVVLALAGGVALCGLVGLSSGSFSVWDWALATHGGIVGGMGELIIVSLMAAGLFRLIEENGGIQWLKYRLMRGVRTRRKAEGSLAALTLLANLSTANNTIALILTTPIARNIVREYGIDPRRAAGLLDTFSCFAQGMLPYGAQLLIASGLAGGIAPVAILPHLHYPFLIGISSLVAIWLRYPRRYAGRP
ncbi:MAG: Na+/H+ antiporter NhaC family protein [Tannerellaceae bacterium]|nr:Na+/H+ antiporter NhaC family protein [Tannerellaceae bacterium]